MFNITNRRLVDYLFLSVTRSRVSSNQSNKQLEQNTTTQTLLPVAIPAPCPDQIYDIRLKSYRSELEEFQPSWDGSVKRIRGTATAVEHTVRDLDSLNSKYNWLVDQLWTTVQQHLAADPQVINQISPVLPLGCFPSFGLPTRVIRCIDFRQTRRPTSADDHFLTRSGPS
jgi:hypothetical protein